MFSPRDPLHTLPLFHNFLWFSTTSFQILLTMYNFVVFRIFAEISTKKCSKKNSSFWRNFYIQSILEISANNFLQRSRQSIYLFQISWDTSLETLPRNLMVFSMLSTGSFFQDFSTGFILNRVSNSFFKKIYTITSLTLLSGFFNQNLSNSAVILTEKFPSIRHAISQRIPPRLSSTWICLEEFLKTFFFSYKLTKNIHGLHQLQGFF